MLTLVRKESTTDQTMGVLYWNDEVVAFTLELPWRDNQFSISCIPEGKYPVKKHKSPTFGDCFLIQKTEPRTHILIHGGNFHWDTRGCVLVGEGFTDLNHDGQKDLKSSLKTLNHLLDILPSTFTIHIKKDERDESLS